jgi:hypothetical protein
VASQSLQKIAAGPPMGDSHQEIARLGLEALNWIPPRC